MRLALLFFSTYLLSCVHSQAWASVVLTGTRVIYPEAQSGQTLQFSNADKHPYLVQMWLDAGDTESAQEMGHPDEPFTLSPPIFRMEPGSTQAVRLILTGGPELPADRESVFYLNFTQLPALSQDAMDANQLVVLLKSRIKVFYRPRKLSRPDTRKLACTLRFHMDGNQVQVENPMAFHAVIVNAELVSDDGRSVPLLADEMLAPFSLQQWPLPDTFAVPTGDVQVRVKLINDYGADQVHACPWS